MIIHGQKVFGIQFQRGGKEGSFLFSIFPPPLLDGGGVFTVEVHSPSGCGEVGRLWDPVPIIPGVSSIRLGYLRGEWKYPI